MIFEGAVDKHFYNVAQEMDFGKFRSHVGSVGKYQGLVAVEIVPADSVEADLLSSRFLVRNPFSVENAIDHVASVFVTVEPATDAGADVALRLLEYLAAKYPSIREQIGGMAQTRYVRLSGKGADSVEIPHLGMREEASRYGVQRRTIEKWRLIRELLDSALNDDEIGEKIRIDPRTVRRHRKRMKEVGYI